MVNEDSFLQEYLKLNPQQKSAVDWIDGPLIVIAGPGSGKTQILSLRTANILRQTDTLPQSVLCLTFTDSASVNMQKRLQKYIGFEAFKINVHTFHGFCLEVINRNPEYFFHGADFKPADELAQIDIVQGILKKLPHTNPLSSFHPENGWVYLKDILSRIQDLKKSGLSAEEYKQLIYSNLDFWNKFKARLITFFENYKAKNIREEVSKLITDLEMIPENNHTVTIFQNVGLKTAKENLKNRLVKIQSSLEENEKVSTKEVTLLKNQICEKDHLNQLIVKELKNQEKHITLADIYKEYEKLMDKAGLFDFEDMLLKVNRAFEKYPDLKYNYQERYLYLLVDEFQDTSGVQIRLLNHLINLEITEGKPNIMVVGDDDQAIYKFQGASLENILNFKDTYKQTRVVTLTKNYRSKQEILDLAMKVIDNCEVRLNEVINVDKTLESQVR